MKEYEINRTIDASEVDVTLLQDIEQLLVKELDQVHGSVKALMSGIYADQSFDRLSDFDKAEIPDGVTSISLTIQSENLANEVGLSFSEDSGKNKLHIRLTGSDAQSKALGIAEKIESKLGPRKVMTRFIHAWSGYPLFILFGVLPAGYLARHIVEELSRLDAFYSLFACTVYTLISVFIIRQFVPYCVFDSPFNRKAKVIAGYVAYSFSAILVFIALATSWVLFVQD